MFRFRNQKTSLFPPSPIDEVVAVSNFDEHGVERVSFVSQPCAVNSDSIPNCSDYVLSDLLAAGVPLSPVALDSSLSPSDASIDAFVSNLDTDNNSVNI